MSNHSSTPCALETLAHNEVVQVQRCMGCGHLSIHVGPFTMRLEERAADALFVALGEAFVELRIRRNPNDTLLRRPGLA